MPDAPDTARRPRRGLQPLGSATASSEGAPPQPKEVKPMAKPTRRATHELHLSMRYRGTRRRLTLFVMLPAALVVACCALPARAQSFAEQLNPTGDPIGGGPGYSDIKDPATADFVVSSKAALLSALAQAEAGQVVYVDDAAEIDLSDEQDIVIPGGVT